MRPEVGTTSGVSTSAWLPLDMYSSGYGDGMFVKVTGSVTYSVEITPDDVFNPTVTPNAYPCGVAALTAASTTQQGALLIAAKAVRVNQTAGAGSTVFTVVVKGSAA